MDTVSFCGAVVSRKDLFERPDFWAKQNIIVFAVRDAWWEPLKTYAQEHREELTSQRVSLQKFSGEWSDGAFNLFHEIRDRICEAQGDTSRQNKEHIKEMLKKEYGQEKSLKSYSRKELWGITNIAIDWALEAEADIRDLTAMFGSMYREE